MMRSGFILVGTVPPLLLRHRPSPAFSDQHFGVVTSQRQPVANGAPRQIHSVNGLRVFARQHYRLSIGQRFVAGSPVPLRI